MISIEKKVSGVLNLALKPFPNTPDMFWDMGILHQESIVLIKAMLEELAEIIKVKYNLDYKSNELIIDNYE